MSLEWKYEKLEKLCSFDKKSMDPLDNVEYYHYSFPAFDNNKEPEIELGQDIKSTKLIFKKGDILFNKLNVKFKRVWNIDFDIEDNSICSTEFIPIQAKNIDRDFLYYCLISPNFTNEMKYLSTGTSNSHQRIKPKDLKEYDIFLPKDKITQSKIGYVLKLLDKKISINLEINKTLTKIALLLFKNWFVDFNFLNENNNPYKEDNGKMKDSELGFIPIDWEIDILGNYLKIERGLSYKGKYLSDKGVPLINLGNILPNTEFRLEKLKFYSGEFDRKYEVNVGDILVANTDLTQDRLVLGSPIIVPSLIDAESIIYSHHINRLSNFKLPKFYIFYNLLSERYNHMVSGYATGTTVLAISKKSINDYQIVLPPEKLLLKFEEIAKNIEKIKDNNLLEIKKLTKIRDTLLPELMSGEIDVSNITL